MANAFTLDPPVGGGAISSPYLVSPTRAGNTTPMVPGDRVGRRQGGTMETMYGVDNQQVHQTGYDPMGPAAGGGRPPVNGYQPNMPTPSAQPRPQPQAGPVPIPPPVGPRPPMATSTQAKPTLAELQSSLASKPGTSAVAPPMAMGDPSQQVGPLGTQAIGLNNLGAIIERQLAQPGGFGTAEAMKARDYFSATQEADRARAMGNINADAAGRGLYFSTVPMTDAGTLEAGLARERAGFDAAMMDKIASSQQTGLQSAIGNAFNFLGNAQAGNQGLAALGQAAMAQGTQNEPTIGQGGAFFANQPMAQPPAGIDPALWQVLGSMMNPGQSPGAPANTAASSTWRPVSSQPATPVNGIPMWNFGGVQ